MLHHRICKRFCPTNLSFQSSKKVLTINETDTGTKVLQLCSLRIDLFLYCRLENTICNRVLQNATTKVDIDLISYIFVLHLVHRSQNALVEVSRRSIYMSTFALKFEDPTYKT